MEREDLFKGRTCEVCGNPDYLAGVASSPLGAMSFLYCGICLRMGAENKTMIDATVECSGGLKNIRNDLPLTYFDKESGSYKDYRNHEIIPIELKDSTKKFEKREELVEWLKQQEE